MSQKKEYRSAVRSRRMIRAALLELLRQKRLEKITVTDIVTQAQINRSTFYAHYPDVNGLLEEMQNEVIESSLSIFSEMEFQDLYENPKNYLRKLMDIATENRELFTLLGESTQALRQLEIAKTTLLEKSMNVSTIPENIRGQMNYAISTSFFIGGIINTFQQWNQGTLNCTEEEIISELASLITASMNTVKDK